MESVVLQGEILSFLETDDPEARQGRLIQASGRYRLHERYRELGIFREDRNEWTERFGRLLAISTGEFAGAIGLGNQKGQLGLLQYGFEIGRHAVDPRHEVVRRFIHTLFELPIGGLPIKYSLFAGGVLYSGSGRTHDEMAQDFVRLGLGAVPVTGGVFGRTETLAFRYDTSSTAYRTGDPNLVRESLLKGIRTTGGREDLVIVKLEPGGVG